MIEKVRNLSPLRVHHWLEEEIREHLTPDPTRYAPGRLRAWLTDEPTPTHPPRLLPGLSIPPNYIHRLRELIGWNFDFCLATYSGDRAAHHILAHRDAPFADYEAYLWNISGTCTFRYWEERKSFDAATKTRDYNPKKDPPTHKLFLQPGDLIRFHCKNLHAASPSPRRWCLHFWKQKPR